jgi:hypothetical protein
VTQTTKGVNRWSGRPKSSGRTSAVLCLAAIFPLSFFVSAQTTPRGGEEFKISTSVVLVLLDVSVKDSKGGYVPGLSKDAFQPVRGRSKGTGSTFFVAALQPGLKDPSASRTNLRCNTAPCFSQSRLMSVKVR